jgi:diguanylate cyclase (GGDEF)-like protein/PAS domain S-box-containing protein
MSLSLPWGRPRPPVGAGRNRRLPLVAGFLVLTVAPVVSLGALGLRTMQTAGSNAPGDLLPLLMATVIGVTVLLIVAAALVARSLRRRDLAEAEVKRSAERFESVIQSVGHALLLIDAYGVIEEANVMAAQLLAKGGERLRGHRLGEWVLPNDRESLARHLAECTAPGRCRVDGSESCEMLLSLPNGSTSAVAFTLSQAGHGERPPIVCVLRDVSAEHKTRRVLQKAALTDPLTGLANRRCFEDRLEHALEIAARQSQPCSLMSMDMDGFKQVNDDLGHQAGDALLVAVSQRLRSALRQSDTIARLGGDEFAVIALDVDTAGASVLASKVMAAMAAPVEVGGTMVTPRLSIGIASFPQHAADPTALVAASDRALYAAKRDGRGRVSTAGAPALVPAPATG